MTRSEFRGGFSDLAKSATEFPGQTIPLVEKTGPLRRRVALGMTVYNGARFVQETIDSIVAQDFADFALVILDDCSQDGSAEIVAEAARRHDNIFAFRHVVRRSMITTWADVYHLSRMIVPNHEFFAWCSDHDVLKPAWLGALVRTLQDHPEAAHAYPLSAHIDSFGMLATQKQPTPAEFSTKGCDDPVQRFLMLNDAVPGAGNIVYGLVRSEFMPRIGVFRRLLLPDRMYFGTSVARGTASGPGRLEATP
jgi:glycosyltransferase involved in cell wall biosynthesis